MHIAYVGQFKKIYDEEGIARSLERLGHKVDRYSEKVFGKRDQDKIIASKPDFLLYAKLKIKDDLANELIAMAKAVRIPTVCWMPDLYFGLPRQWRAMHKDGIFRSDLVCSPDGGNDKQWKRLRIKHVVLRQGIYDKECQVLETKVDTRIIFVGTFNPSFPYRQKLIEFLQKTYGDQFVWYGKEDANEIREEELTRLYQSCSIVIGDSVKSRSYWSNRIYETLGRGGFLIHPMVEGLEKEFEPYKHFVPYNYGDFDGLKEKIDYYLLHPSERDRIRWAGMKHCMENHTLIQRSKELIEHVLRLTHNK